MNYESWRELNEDLWIMKDKGRDLKRKSWRKGAAGSRKVSLKKLEPGYELKEGRA
jgi:hypothetical protein